MVKMLILLPDSDDPASIRTYVRERLAPTLGRTEGVVSISVSEGEMMSPQGAPPYSQVVTASFEDLSQVIAFGNSPGTIEVRNEGERIGALVLMFQAREM